MRAHFQWPIEKVSAAIALRNAVGYYADLRAFRNGDRARFSRMVDGRGSQYPNCNEHVFASRIRAVCAMPDVQLHFTNRCRRLLASVEKQR